MKAAFVGRVSEFVLLVEQNRIQSLVEDEYIYGTRVQEKEDLGLILTDRWLIC